MRIEIIIPTEFEKDFNDYRFSEFFNRVIADMHAVCGNYEKETAEMFINALKNAVVVEPEVSSDYISELNNSSIEPIKRSLDEVAERYTQINLCDKCNEICIGNCSTKSFEKRRWIDFLTGK